MLHSSIHACMHAHVSSARILLSGVEFDDHITSMVELLSSQYTGTSTFEEEEGSEDAASLKTRNPARENKGLEVEDSDEDSADKPVGDEGTGDRLHLLCIVCICSNVLWSIYSMHLFCKVIICNYMMNN